MCAKVNKQNYIFFCTLTVGLKMDQFFFILKLQVTNSFLLIIKNFKQCSFKRRSLIFDHNKKIVLINMID